MDIRELRETLIIANKILDQEDLARPYGHISVRIPGTKRFLITRSVAPGIATDDDILVCNLQGKVVQGKYSQTFGEVMGHIGIFKKRKDVNSVAHTHSYYVVALSMTETTLLSASFDAMRVGDGPIPFYKKIVFLEKPEIGEEVAELLGSSNAVILKGHGAMVVGKSIEEAVTTAIGLERAAKLQLLASTAGKLVVFTEKEKKTLIEFGKMMNQRGGTAPAVGRTWEYYKSQLNGPLPKSR